jgi:hypothetical protein
MSRDSAVDALVHSVTGFRLPDEEIAARARGIHERVLASSEYIRTPNYTVIHPDDLAMLFVAYDEAFFGGLCRQALQGTELRFRLSPRMTRAGGTTARYRLPSGESRFEITVASSMLYEGFRETDRNISVCGLECANRLEALQRIFEHELVHLVENICWQRSNCRAERFQDAARRHFLHRAHTHRLITRRERAADSGIRIGSQVTFVFDGCSLSGRVNRLTKRATVLVDDPLGELFSDGRRYRCYYVPLVHLRAVASN